MAVIVDELRRIPMSQRLVSTLALAAEFAQAQHHPDVSLEHLLLALTDDGDAAQVLSASHVDTSLLKADVSQFLSGLPAVGQAASIEQLQIAPDLRRILEAAAAAASQGRRREINGAIVLAAIVGDGKSSAAHMLRAQGLTFEEAIKALQRALAASAPPPPPDAEDILANARARVQNRTMPGLAASPPTAGGAAKANPVSTVEAEPAEPTPSMAQAAPPVAEPPHPVESPPPPASAPKLRSKIAIDDFRSAMSTELEAPEVSAIEHGASRPAPAIETSPAEVPHPNAAGPAATDGQGGRSGAPFEQPPPEIITVPWPTETTAHYGSNTEDAGYAASGYTYGARIEPEFGDGGLGNSAPPYEVTEPPPPYSDPVTPVMRPQPELIASPHRSDSEHPPEDLKPVDRPTQQPSVVSTAVQLPRTPTPQPGSRWPAPVGPAWQPETSHQPAASAVAVPPPIPPVLIDPASEYLGSSEPTAPFSGLPAGWRDGPGEAAPWADASVFDGSLPPPPPLPPGEGVQVYEAGAAGPSGTLEHGFSPDHIATLEAYQPAGNPDTAGGGSNYSGANYDHPSYGGQSTGGPSYAGLPHDGSLYAEPTQNAPGYGRPGYPEQSPPAPYGTAPGNALEAAIVPVQPAPMAPLAIDSAGTRGRRVPIDQSVAGQLVENIPRRMRVSRASPVEVRLANADARRMLDGIDGSPNYGDRPAPAMSVKLRTPDGGFIIDGISRETQWIETGFEADREFVQWRWTVTPTKSGRRRLQLLLSARTTNAPGTASDTMLPDQVVEIAVGANYGRLFATALTWAAIAVAGGLIARYGNTIYDPVVAGVIQLIR